MSFKPATPAHFLAAVALQAALALPAAGQIIGFNDGFGWSRNGWAWVDKQNLYLTNSLFNQASSAFFVIPQPVTKPFTVGFFYMAGNFDPFYGGADGFTFCLQNEGPTAVGGSGSNLGYLRSGAQGIAPSVAVAFNIYGGSRLGILENGRMTYYLPTSLCLRCGHPIGIIMRFGDNISGNPPDVDTLAWMMQDTVNGDRVDWARLDLPIPTLVGGNTAYIGFTGSTGLGFSTQKIYNFFYVPGAAVDISGVNLGPAQTQQYSGSLMNTGTSTHHGTVVLIGPTVLYGWGWWYMMKGMLIDDYGADFTNESNVSGYGTVNVPVINNETFIITGGPLISGPDTPNYTNNGSTTIDTGVAMTGFPYTQAAGTTTVNGTLETGSGYVSGGTMDIGPTGTIDMSVAAASGKGPPPGPGLNSASAPPLTIHSGAVNDDGSIRGDVVIDSAAGQLAGRGTITGNLTNSGLVSPGHNLGTLTLSGNLSQTAAGTLRAIVAGPAAGQFGQLAVGGTAVLDGTLTIVSPIRPRPAQEFVILTAPTVTGVFAQVTGSKDFEVVYTPDSVKLISTTTSAGFARADFNHDYGVDQLDVQALEACRSGPAIQYSDDCGDKDLDGDGDVDQNDFGVLQRCYSGPGMADPNCAN
ncbi:MAG TPA: hypothetical protein PKY77_24745 [Phycisphaerae bacterium]|nr:hypothetical protein [Phycisphaerae bacterium]HRY71410.1 hypothetical protein [Phycisphaerae bacterium]HSA29905.1 hypothetical protein [Phycisphaerae bacterium]